MATPQPVPCLRAGVRAVHADSGMSLEDTVQDLQIKVDPAVHRVASLLDGERGAEALAREAGAQLGATLPEEAIARVVGFLDAYFLLDTPRARGWIAWLEAQPKPSPRDPLASPAGARFSCHACGDCCRGFNFGPLHDADVERLLRHDWSELPGIETSADVIVERPGGRFLRPVDGHCIFLGDDGLCLVHKRHGAAEKPLFCRTFPYAFTGDAAGGVRASLRFECSTLHRSQTDGEPLAAQTEALQALVDERPTPPAAPPSLVFFAAARALPGLTVTALEQKMRALLATDHGLDAQVHGLGRLLGAVAGRLPPLPDAAAIEACQQFLAGVPIEALFAPLGEAPPQAAQALDGIVARLVETAMHRFFRFRSSGRFLPGGWDAQEAVIVSLLGLRRRLRERAGLEPAVPAFAHAEAAAVEAMPEAEALFRDFLRHALFGAGLASYGTVLGGVAALLAQLWLARWHARCLAVTRGATSLGAADAMGGLLGIQRQLGEEILRGVFAQSARELQALLGAVDPC